MPRSNRTGDGWMGEILGGSAVLWRGAPDPAAYAAGERRATRPRLGLAICLGAVGAALGTLYLVAVARLPWPTDWKEAGDNVVGAALYAAKLLAWAIVPAAVAGGVLAARRWAARHANRVTYVLTEKDIVVFVARGATRHDLDLVVGVDWRPGRYGPERGDVIVRLLAAGDDERQNPFGIGRAVVLHGVAEPERVCALVREACAARGR